MKPPFLVLLRGAPSSGKTTVAYLLSKRVSNTVKVSIDNLIAMNVPSRSITREWIEMRPLGHDLAGVLVRDLLERERNVIL